MTLQHGNPDGLKDPWLNASSTGADSELLTWEELVENRLDIVKGILEHPLEDEHYQGRSPDWEKVTVPFLSAANFAGLGVHTRGNYEAFLCAASKHKWLECHPGRHEGGFYLQQGIGIQKRFLDYFLKGEENG